MQKIDSFESLVAHLHEADGSYAKSSLEAYFYKNAYTGSSFENFCGKDHDKFTADDIVAVSMLSVKIPPSASRWILGDGQKCLTKLLKELDPKLAIQDPKADLSIGKTAWNLWKEIHSLRGVGETMASKLLATKRPLLFPIFDQHVARALKLAPNRYWKPWQKFMRSENGTKAGEIVKQMAADLGKPELSTLRLLDVVVWMQQHGHKSITQELVNEGTMINVNYAPQTRPK
jgi:hypothetical protein